MLRQRGKVTHAWRRRLFVLQKERLAKWYPERRFFGFFFTRARSTWMALDSVPTFGVDPAERVDDAGSLGNFPGRRLGPEPKPGRGRSPVHQPDVGQIVSSRLHCWGQGSCLLRVAKPRRACPFWLCQNCESSISWCRPRQLLAFS